MTRTTVSVFDATVAAGIANAQAAVGATTAANGNGGWKDIRAFNGGHLLVSVTNAAGAPGARLRYIVQVTDVDGSTFYADRWAGAGDTSNNGYQVSQVIHIPKDVSYIRVIAFGNTTVGVNLKALFLGSS